MALGVSNNNTGIAQGAALTQVQVQRILVQPLQAASVFLSSGPTIFDTDGSPVRVPLMAPPLAPMAFVGENEQIPEANPVFGEMDLLPSTMKGVKVITRYSEELARQSIVALDAALQSRLVTDVAATLDATFFASATTDGTVPTGMLNYSGIQTATIGSALSIDNLHDAWGLAAAAFVNLSSLRWFMRTETFTALRKLKATGSGDYVLQPDPTQDNVYRLLGHQVVITNRIPITGATGSKKTQVVLADMSQVAVARDLAPSVRILTERYADFDQLAIRTKARYDAKPMNPQAIVRLDSINAPG